jgi:hypothetical protein
MSSEHVGQTHTHTHETHTSKHQTRPLLLLHPEPSDGWTDHQLCTVKSGPKGPRGVAAEVKLRTAFGLLCTGTNGEQPPGPQGGNSL